MARLAEESRGVARRRAHGFEAEGLRRAHYRRKDGSLRSSLVMALLLEE